MPRKLDLEALDTELNAVTTLLAEARAQNDPVGCLQYEQRKQELDREIDDARATKAHQASVAMYFGGKPVFGSRGIAADFAGKALEYFQDIISKQFAKSELGALGERGRVPFRDFATLMVTGVTQGSFGFLLDELNPQTQMFDTELKEMVKQVMAVIQSAGSPEEADFEQAAETLDPRTLIALQAFFMELDSSAATVRLVDDERDFALDAEAVRRARVRTEATVIEEKDTEIAGELRGFLPEHRRFELRPTSGDTIYGSATEAAQEQFSSTLQNGNSMIGKNCVAVVRERAVRPLNRPPRLVYRLLEFRLP